MEEPGCRKCGAELDSKGTCRPCLVERIDRILARVGNRKKTLKEYEDYLEERGD